VFDINALPDDAQSLKRLLLEQHAASLAKDVRLREKEQQIEHLKFLIAKLRRARFGQSSEVMEGAGQLPLLFEQLKAALAEAQRQLPTSAQSDADQPKKAARRKPLPEHFERVDNVIAPKECACPDCGGPLKGLGDDRAEVLEVKTVTFKVTRHIRPKQRCTRCATIVQAPAPSRPIPKSYAGASLLALVLTWKYGFHIPMYRQCQIFAHAGLTVSRATLVDWVAAMSELLGPLVAALGRYVLSASNLNADDTPFRVLAPGTGKTRRGHMWTYVRDGTRWGSTDPPAVWYQYSPSWHGKYPQAHLANFRGKLQVDAYAGFEPLFVPSDPNSPARVQEVSCMGHARRHFFEVFKAVKSPLAKEAIDRIDVLYDIERDIRGQSADARKLARQALAVPLLDDIHTWMMQTVTQIDGKSALAGAFHYSLNRWESLCRYTDDGRLEIDNLIAERSIRGMGIGRRNFLFFGSDSGGERAAIIYALIETCKLNKIDPHSYLQYVIERIADHPINKIDQLLPWNVADQIKQKHIAPESKAA
jgi:transposase